MSQTDILNEVHNRVSKSINESTLSASTKIWKELPEAARSGEAAFMLLALLYAQVVAAQYETIAETHPEARSAAVCAAVIGAVLHAPSDCSNFVLMLSAEDADKQVIYSSYDPHTLSQVLATISRSIKNNPVAAAPNSVN